MQKPGRDRKCLSSPLGWIPRRLGWDGFRRLKPVLPTLRSSADSGVPDVGKVHLQERRRFPEAEYVRMETDGKATAGSWVHNQGCQGFHESDPKEWVGHFTAGQGPVRLTAEGWGVSRRGDGWRLRRGRGCP